ncbi:helix-turn-helix transcriptional regulator [Acinetobacter modestus]|uniref:helix-turn-helix transcriptional regulator n=1 Tax=Acinetobacter modestus TaxID=1776740 RepID=UPI001F4AFF6D|nr:AlpA family phage regulatory protein [Acinetobacter modestus]MCH7328095.1 AlpA family phage regulatory protein [Acinetobacter modestus]
MQIDNRVRAKEFMKLLSIKKSAFYEMVKNGQIQQPIRMSKKDVFWHESYVKCKVEEAKNQTESIACS